MGCFVEYIGPFAAMEMVDWMDGEDDDPCEVSWFWYGWIMVNMETTDNDAYVVEIDCYLVHRLNSVFLYCSIIVRRVVSTMRRLYLFFWIKHDDGYTNNRKNKILLLVLRDNLCYCLFHSPFLSLSLVARKCYPTVWEESHKAPGNPTLTQFSFPPWGHCSSNGKRGSSGRNATLRYQQTKLSSMAPSSYPNRTFVPKYRRKNSSSRLDGPRDRRIGRMDSIGVSCCRPFCLETNPTIF